MRATDANADDLAPVMTTADLAQMISVTARVHLSPEVRAYIVALTSATRPGEEHLQEKELRDIRSSVLLGASPRASVALGKAAQANAATEKRAFVTSQDVKDLAISVLAHRLVLQPEAELQGITPESLVERIVLEVPDAVSAARA